MGGTTIAFNNATWDYAGGNWKIYSDGREARGEEGWEVRVKEDDALE